MSKMSKILTSESISKIARFDRSVSFACKIFQFHDFSNFFSNLFWKFFNFFKNIPLWSCISPKYILSWEQIQKVWWGNNSQLLYKKYGFREWSKTLLSPPFYGHCTVKFEQNSSDYFY